MLFFTDYFVSDNVSFLCLRVWEQNLRVRVELVGVDFSCLEFAYVRACGDCKHLDNLYGPFFDLIMDLVNSNFIMYRS